MKLAAIVATCACLVLAPLTGAQAGDREGNWETRLGLVFQNSTDVDFDGGTTAEFESGTGFKLGIAYHYTDNLEIGFNIGLDQQDYTSDIVGENGAVFPIEGELEYTTAMLDLTYNFMDGPFTPFVVGGIGWAWMDTNIGNEPPQTGCWWTWYGYVCTTWQDTKTFDGLAYQLGAGLRYDFSDTLAVHGSYRMTWMELDQATSTPDIDGFQLSIGWKF